MKLSQTALPPVAVVLKKQLILPLCTAAVESFNNDTSATVEFKHSDSFTNDQSKPWLDGVYFNEAMHDLLAESIRYHDNKENITVSLRSSGPNSWRVVISYLLCQSAGKRFDNAPGYTPSSRTRDIISQHHAKMSFDKKDQKANVSISFDK